MDITKSKEIDNLENPLEDIPKTLKVQSLRNKEYYSQMKIQDKLYLQSKQNKTFKNLMPLITSKDNILLAYRNIKNNKGSTTAGIDNKTIKDLESLEVEKFIKSIQNSFKNYTPKAIRRVEIPKPFSNKKRPLGIPVIKDRIIQQAIKQILEPICEAKFHKHSYGFRPQRSTKDAIARFNHLINQNELHYVIDIDIQGFFDNVKHSKLSKQIWTLGIRDKNLITIISKMLKAEVKDIGIPKKGTPQGGILSPLLSNIVLNELDWWISNQWETFKTKHDYSRKRIKKRKTFIDNSHKYQALKKTKLKECYIVRYADDFKILCRNHNEAKRLYIAIQMWLKERLGLEVSQEKSKITNLKREYSEFLGFKIKAKEKGKKNNSKEIKYVAHSFIGNKAFKTILLIYKSKIKLLQKSKINVSLLNSYILGIHNYYKIATHCNIDFNKIHSLTRHLLKNRLKPTDITDKSKIPKYMDKLGYTKSKQLRNVLGEALLPISYIQHKSAMCSSQLNIYDLKDRAIIHKEQQAIPFELLQYVLNNPIKDCSTQYNDNRISKLVATLGKCEVSGMELEIGNMECHHKLPKYLGGNDEYNNLVWVITPIHKLIHITNTETIQKYLDLTNLSKEGLNKLNKLRKLAGNQSIA